MDTICNCPGPCVLCQGSDVVGSTKSDSVSSAPGIDLESGGGRTAPLEMPYRTVGGAPVEGVLEWLVDKGLLAQCSTHGPQLFWWMGRNNCFACPDLTCTSVVYYEDMISSADGGEVFW